MPIVERTSTGINLVSVSYLNNYEMFFFSMWELLALCCKNLSGKEVIL